jgi:ferredoxin
VAYKINDDCLACGICNAARVCPNGAITEGDEIAVVDPSRCTECVGANPAPVCIPDCPAQAVMLDSAHQESREELLAKWRSLHPGEEPKLFS